jgi:DNA-binding XRE family transcriptional regulator
MSIQIIRRDGKPEYAVLSWADYQTLIEASEDAADSVLLDVFKEKLASGEEETVPSAVVDALLSGTGPVRVWREYRGLTQDALATQAGISKACLCQIESGKRRGTMKTLHSIAASLNVQVEDLQE